MRLKGILAPSNYETDNEETERIISLWKEGGNDFGYFEKAENPTWLEGFWSDGSKFFELFQLMDHKYILEIGCGAGRHAEKVINNCEHLWLLDTSKAALKIAENRLLNKGNFTTILSSTGNGIPHQIKKDTLTSIFSYDSMVHFEYDSVISYIKDSYRVLTPGGMALFHHSNYDKNPGGSVEQNPAWRNFMSQKLFIHIAKRNGFKIIESVVFDWAEENTDCLTLLQK
ncbi:class I SAM-dependent methyltransferase [Sabulibacter ruber]|uniref:class I SAM-dependent methyltransferase n=1 Tax=Sabulibacter ruber TaxID=2811901 RepID=UPI001A97110D|nr:class I SAM-dependent methyltransferase [Sabulibacter ruber]